MEKNETLTYRNLIDRLKELGYSQHTIGWNDGSQKWEFRHRDLENASIILTPHALEQTVAQWHLNTVRAILQAHGLRNYQDSTVV